MGARENKFKIRTENFCKHGQILIDSFFFYEYFQVFNAKFNIRSRCLVLIARSNFFERYLKES